MYLPVSLILHPTVTAAYKIYSSNLVLKGDGVFDAAQVVHVGDSWLKRYLYVIWVQNPSNPLRVSMLVWYGNSGFPSV